MRNPTPPFRPDAKSPSSRLTGIWDNPVLHLKGVRFGFPLVKRFGLLKHHETCRFAWNRHPDIKTHYVLKGDIAWELRGKDAPPVVSYRSSDMTIPIARSSADFRTGPHSSGNASSSRDAFCTPASGHAANPRTSYHWGLSGIYCQASFGSHSTTISRSRRVDTST